MAAILSKTIWNPDKNVWILNGPVFECLGHTIAKARPFEIWPSKVLISNVSGIKMVWFQIPTVVWISDPHCSVLTLRTKNCLKKGSQKLFLITDIYFLVNRMYHWRYNTKNSMKWKALVLRISTSFRILRAPKKLVEIHNKRPSLPELQWPI